MSPDELRAKAASMPDPRQAEADLIWRAIHQVVTEEGLEIALERREDMILSTSWRVVEGDLHQRVRFIVLLAPMGIGINVAVKHARRPQDAPMDQPWEEVQGSPLTALEKKEEQRLSQRVYTLWQDMR